jgi:hypothetical protein
MTNIEESALSLERALADLEMIQAAYPDEISLPADEHGPYQTLPRKFTLHLSEHASLTMELQEGYPTRTGVQISDFRSTKPTDKMRLESVVQAVRRVAKECQDDEMEGSISCCAAALEAWNDADSAFNETAETVEANGREHLRIQETKASSTTSYNWISGEPLLDRKSAFQAHICAVHSEKEAREALHQLITSSSKIQRATHNMSAWRVVETFPDGRTIVKHDNDDDGEDAAGSKLAYLLDMRKDENVLVVVSRWYGGVQLGPKRFAHIVNVARELLVANPQISSGVSDSTDKRRNKIRGNTNSQGPFTLSSKQIDEYLENGVLVVDNVLSASEVEIAKRGFQQSLQTHGVHSFGREDESSAKAFDKLSSTNGSGGVLDIFYDDWKLHGIATNAKLFSITTQLWKAAYNQGGCEGKHSLPLDKQFQWHPYGGDIDFDKGFVYIDRVGYRLPTSLSQAWGDRIHPEQKKKKLRSVQRSLTPHLDCCPDDFFSDKAKKWRPIQCFVSLTDNLQPNTGGFEAASGFHRVFDEWAEERRQHLSVQSGNGTQTRTSLCVGEYTHIRPQEDESVMKRVRHIPVKAGSAVLWDNRIPHANSYKNDSNTPRMVVYCSFLPFVEKNRRYVRQQLQAWKEGRPVLDQWNNIDETSQQEGTNEDHLESKDENSFTPLGKRLMGIESW